ncbi:hypothetical protein G6F70_008745 [Rhizopus microsporus]|nr:hypothetical protein G6F70_008745 [Rhizopus microsporus]
MDIDKRGAVDKFITINDFISAFEDVLSHYDMPIDKQWPKYLTTSFRFGDEAQRLWFKSDLFEKRGQFKKWADVKSKLVRRYSETLTVEDYQSQLRKCRQQAGETIIAYIDRFSQLMKKAKIQDSMFMATFFHNSLYDGLRSLVKKKMIELNQKGGSSTEEKVKELFDKREEEKQRKNNASKRSYDQAGSSGSQEKNKRPSFNTFRNGGSNKPSREEEASKRNIELKNPCRFCNKAEYSKEHRCDEYLQFRSYFEKRQDGRIQNKAFIQRENSKRINTIKKKDPKEIAEYHDEENVKLFQNVMKSIKESHREQCTYNCLALKNNEPDDKRIMKQNPYVPLTPFLLQSQRLYALVDTGSEISLINDEIIEKLKIKINPIKGHIQFADNSKIERVGQTDPLEIKYNGKNIKHKFDVLKSLDCDAPVLFGRDILPKLGIALVGVATNWDNNKVIFDDSIDDKEYIPNVSNAGTELEHKTLLTALQPIIDLNQKTDIKELCDIPEAIVRLETPDGVFTNQRQYPIADALMPVFNEAVASWLENGTIIPATSTPWNHPITFAPKKDNDGNKTGFRPCLDPRNLNKLLPSDNQPIPLIQGIFSDIGGSDIFSTLDLRQAYHRLPIYEPH